MWLIIHAGIKVKHVSRRATVMFLLWTFFSKDELDKLQWNYFMSKLQTKLKLISRSVPCLATDSPCIVWGPWMNHSPPVWWSTFRFMFLNDSWYVSVSGRQPPKLGAIVDLWMSIWHAYVRKFDIKTQHTRFEKHTNLTRKVFISCDRRPTSHIFILLHPWRMA